MFILELLDIEEKGTEFCFLKLEFNTKQAGAELCQAQGKLRLFWC